MNGARYRRIFSRFARFGRNGLPVLSEREMSLLIDLERERCDRGGVPFSLVEFERTESDRGNAWLLEKLLAPLRQRVRRIDMIGWLNGRLAVLMPNTNEEGARKAVDEVLDALALNPPLNYFVSVYPREIGRGRVGRASDDPRHEVSGAARLAAQGGIVWVRPGAWSGESGEHPYPLGYALTGCQGDWKRALDLIGALGMLLCLAPLLLGCVLYLQVRDPGPVFFRQQRIGWQGRAFMMLKLRSMRAGADQTQHRNHLRSLIRANASLTKLDSRGDLRIIPGAQWMRKLGIDELPQLINVLRGEMSLVGPRPCMAYEACDFAPWQRARFKVRPGLTGAWQVNGKNRTTFRRMMELDVGYANEPTLWKDIGILLRTVPAVIGYARH